MHSLLTSEQVRAAEARVLRRGVDNKYLRMSAATAVADAIFCRAHADGTKTAVFCGGGGNGCDGILIAAILHGRGCTVAAYLVGEQSDENKSAAAYAVSEGLPVYGAQSYDGDADIVIDAIFGIGLNRAVSGATADLIEFLNSSKKAFRLAVDIPSGLNADSGEVMGAAFRADVTVTFSCYKRGMLFGGRDFCGRIVVADIGVEAVSDVKVYEHSDFAVHRRKTDAHKGTCGRVFVIGGCGRMIGAPVMSGAAAHAAHLNGAGTVTVCLPKMLRVAAASRCTMSMMKFLSDTPDGYIRFVKSEFDEIIRRADAIDIGMGMGETPDLRKMLEYLCANFDGALILDADALNAIKGDYGFLAGRAEITVTPHVGEFERLTGQAATLENAMALAREIKGIVVLKSATTVITNGRDARVNIAGTPAMAKGGMGDLLGGAISALVCSYPLYDAATVACYRNGIGAERAVSSYAELMLTARDVLNYGYFKELY